MKVNVFYSTIAVCISALISYGVYSFCQSENNLLLAVGSFLFIGFPLILAMGVSSDLSKSSVNMKVLMVVCFLITLIINVIFACLASFLIPLYIILNGIITLVFFLIYHSIYSSKQ